MSFIYNLNTVCKGDLFVDLLLYFFKVLESMIEEKVPPAKLNSSKIIIYLKNKYMTLQLKTDCQEEIELLISLYLAGMILHRLLHKSGA